MGNEEFLDKNEGSEARVPPLTREEKREKGKSAFFGLGRAAEEKREGLSLILEAKNEGDAEAEFILGRLILDGMIRVSIGDSAEIGLTHISNSLRRGYLPARGFLNKYFSDTYEREIASPQRAEGKPHRLTDFRGKPIKINRRGLLTPIDATLTFKGGVNILTLSANVNLLPVGDEVEDYDKLLLAILDGFKAWEGQYEVFGGQRLTVKVELTTEARVFDNVTVIPLTRSIAGSAAAISEKLGARGDRTSSLVRSNRSFAAVGLRKWSVRSRKVIYLQSRSGAFNEYDEIRHVSKHEFGHALGLGDLYKSASDGLPGVEKGQFKELDCYYVGGNIFNLVMCDHHAPVTNNDIEMVVLAFMENKAQSYQTGPFGKRISAALGKGN